MGILKDEPVLFRIFDLTLVLVGFAACAEFYRMTHPQTVEDYKKKHEKINTMTSLENYSVYPAYSLDKTE